MKEKLTQLGGKMRAGLNAVFEPNMDIKWRMLTMAVIRFLYVFLTFAVLKYREYVNNTGYGIYYVFWKDLIGWVFFLGVTWLYFKLKERGTFLSAVMHVLFILYYIPINAAYGLNARGEGFLFASNLYFLFIILAVFFIQRLLKKKEGTLQKIFPAREEGKLPVALMIFCAVVCLLIVAYKVWYNGFSFSFNLLGEGVYEDRAEHYVFLQSIAGKGIGYLLSILQNLAQVVIPIYLFVALSHKRWLQAAFAALGILCLFSVTSRKGIVFFAAVIVAVWLVTQFKWEDRFERLFEVGVVLLLILCLGERWILDSNRIYLLLVRREMYIPAWMNTCYFSFFINNGPLLWTDDTFLLQNLLPQVYDLPPLEMISATFFGGEIASPNTGMMGEAVMHFGYWGIFVYPPLMAAVLWLIDRVTSPYGKGVMLVMAAKMALQLLNVPLTRTDTILSVVLFTFILWGLLWIRPKKRKEEEIG
jgi:hypothetical protein